MNYQDIVNVNAEIKTINLKGKEYAEVSERVTAFRKLYPTGFIMTEIIVHDGTTVTMKATVGYRENGDPRILGTGIAQEVKGKCMVNSTSYIENCETSAVGRALGFLGLGIGAGICSAEEFSSAYKARDKEEFAEMSEARSDILEAVKGDMETLNTEIERITGGKFSSMDGMNITQLIAIKKIVTKKYGKEANA